MSGLQYHTPVQFREYNISKLRSLRFFAHKDVAVPTTVGHRALFLGELTALVETELTAIGSDAVRDTMPPGRLVAERWNALLAKLVDTWLLQRMQMSVDHRIIMWTNICRIQYVAHRDDDAYRKVYNESRDLESAYLTIGDIAVPDQSLRNFVTHFFLLISRWNDLRFTPDIIRHIEAIWSRIGFFAWNANDDRDIFDHIVYSEPVGLMPNIGIVNTRTGKVGIGDDFPAARTCHAVTVDFLKETERAMEPILRAYFGWIKHRGEAPQQAEELGATTHAALLGYMDEVLDLGARRDGVTIHFTGRIYTRRMLPGEDARAGDRAVEDQVTPQAAVLSERQDVSDLIQELTDTPTFMKDLINAARQRRADAGTEPQFASTYTGRGGASASAAAAAVSGANSGRIARTEALRRALLLADSEDLIMCVLATIVDGAMSHENFGLFDYFSTTRLPISNGRSNIPILVYIGSRWHVSFERTFYECTTAEQAIVQWLTLLCSSADVVKRFDRFTSDISIIYEIYRDMLGKMSPAEASISHPLRDTMGIALPALYE